MRQLNGMQATAPTAATVSNVTASRPTAALGSAVSAGGFSSTFQQIATDVATFIAKGDGGFRNDALPSSQAMSLQAMALRQRGSGVLEEDDSGVDSDTQQQFLSAIAPWATETADKLGVAPELVAAHAALESGWGKQPLKNGAANANNLFGVKAGSGWQGEVAVASTTEYEHGAMLKKTERFRSYPDTASAFRDYADLLTSNPRYAAALNTGSDARAFAQGLAKAGYATDPQYADKLSKVAAQMQRRLHGVTPTED
ncbi:flagellar assembly peptidoglycan hydrolase FlgJ [Duganella sp. FT80W]|uniref:Flagellar assembly peptidoglycan hydrolase FlgJ n=1 Tax=Duganella guangzhouensis TaxID=2666084 RepID=A0A6I2KYZ8_9BURK|nr:glucosaminidase domain-containing protein [Duganella guangzhouensis]MRW90740.1 flagellar assembly peptidoglycan hydrolase FlgJ [Duganella guangzhouensis]